MIYRAANGQRGRKLARQHDCGELKEAAPRTTETDILQGQPVNCRGLELLDIRKLFVSLVLRMDGLLRKQSLLLRVESYASVRWIHLT